MLTPTVLVLIEVIKLLYSFIDPAYEAVPVGLTSLGELTFDELLLDELELLLGDSPVAVFPFPSYHSS